MNRIAVILFCMITGLLSAVPVQAMDLRLKNGKILKHVMLDSIEPDGIRIRNLQNHDWILSFDSLSHASRRMLQDMFQSASATLTGEKPGKPIILPGIPHSICLHSIGILQNGTLGWAESSDLGYGNIPAQYGKIYLYGLFIPQGNVWNGIVYPTTRTIPHRGENYPCFTRSENMAARMDQMSIPGE